MLFSSDVFLFVFLPIVILIYYTLMRNRTLKNIFLFFASLLFYAYGEPKFVLTMIASITVNYGIGLLINTCNKKDKRLLSKIVLIIGILYNLLILFYYKYLMFTVQNINSIFGMNINVKKVILPIGISFFTFQILSYIIDVYRKKVKVQKNIFNLGLYIALFPQLIAGPIVRYETIQEQITNRKENIDDFANGIKRFIKGLGKKVLIANTMAVVADYVFKQPVDTASISVALVWLGALAYTLQIFFDFSGYSDMAIGLGKMFGFKFEENFNYPYTSKSISEFWRRWHISLGTWFKDYLYIPLGGSRCSKKRLIFNLAVVWICTGIWHGANWTFILWGILYFVLLTIEKLSGFEKRFNKFNIIKHVYTMFFVMLGWVLFRADNIQYAFQYILRMFTPKNFFDLKFAELLIENIFIFFIAVIISTPIAKKIFSKIRILNNNICKDIILAMILILSVAYITKGVYNPFIYFNF